MKYIGITVLCLLMCVPLAVAADTHEDTFRALESRISHALITRNANEMNDIFAGDYVSVGVSGQIRSRPEIISLYATGRIAVSSVQIGEMNVRQYGDIAIVVGLLTLSAKDSGADISGRYAFTRVYRRDSGKWRAVSFESTPVK